MRSISILKVEFKFCISNYNEFTMYLICFEKRECLKFNRFGFTGKWRSGRAVVKPKTSPRRSISILANSPLGKHVCFGTAFSLNLKLNSFLSILQPHTFESESMQLQIGPKGVQFQIQAVCCAETYMFNHGTLAKIEIDLQAHLFGKKLCSFFGEKGPFEIEFNSCQVSSG